MQLKEFVLSRLQAATEYVFAAQRHSGLSVATQCIRYVVHWMYNGVSVRTLCSVNVGKVLMLWPHFETGGLSGQPEGSGRMSENEEYFKRIKLCLG